MTRTHTPRVVSEYDPQRTKTREVRTVNRCSVHFWSSRYTLHHKKSLGLHLYGWVCSVGRYRWTWIVPLLFRLSLFHIRHQKIHILHSHSKPSDQTVRSPRTKPLQIESNVTQTSSMSHSNQKSVHFSILSLFNAINQITYYAITRFLNKKSELFYSNNRDRLFALMLVPEFLIARSAFPPVSVGKSMSSSSPFRKILEFPHMV